LLVHIDEGERFVGIASDGLKWVLFERDGNSLVKVKETILDPDKSDAFLAWLDGAIALKIALRPDPLTVRIELGQDSMAFRRANEQLARIWTKWKDDPAVALKRQLWVQLLKLVCGREVESDALFFQHTFLVIVAKAIALAVLGLRDDDPKRVLSGAAFESAGIFGSAESDFFDWVVADADGEGLVRRILTHVRRFRFEEVESDVLKILYESLIDRAERHGLGEYYTPDWLAAKIVRHAVDRPIEQRVLDPACGSGTFLFHAIRAFLADAEGAGLDLRHRAVEATKHIAGMDIHPVAIIIARVTRHPDAYQIPLLCLCAQLQIGQTLAYSCRRHQPKSRPPDAEAAPIVTRGWSSQFDTLAATIGAVFLEATRDLMCASSCAMMAASWFFGSSLRRPLVNIRYCLSLNFERARMRR
jgi:hypothetical protein